jgi:hypothetical protein
VETVSLLGAYASRSLPARATAKVDAHLADCAECRARVEELTDIGGTLRAIALPLPLFLAPAALAHYKAAFGIATHARAAGSLWAVGTAAGERVTRALAVSTSALLALGVISAGLMSGGGGPSPVPGSPSGGAVEAAPQATVTQLPATGSTLIDNAAAVGAHGGFVNESPRVPAATVTQLAAPPPPSGPQSTGTPRTTGPPAQTPAPPAAAGPVLGVRLGANLGIATAGVSVGLGGSCSGLALNSSKPCAGTAPTGVLGLSVTTPLGTLSL